MRERRIERRDQDEEGRGRGREEYMRVFTVPLPTSYFLYFILFLTCHITSYVIM